MKVDGLTASIDRSRVLDDLRRQFLSMPQRRLANGIVKTGWEQVDQTLAGGGLSRGMVHEWIGTFNPAPLSAGGNRHSRKTWMPPLSLLIHLGEQACQKEDRCRVVWIGQAIWPYPPALCTTLERAGQVLTHSLFVRAWNASQRLRATDLVLRSHAAAAVIADGSGFDLTATRRLQIAAEHGETLCLMARPPNECDVPSAAGTRWLVSSCSSGHAKRWTVELLRCKGVQPLLETPQVWVLERDHATRNVIVVPDVVHRSDPAPVASRAQLVG